MISLSHKAVLLLALLAGVMAHAQELEVQPTPFTALIDFPALQKPISKYLPKQALPIWMESVQIVPGDAASDQAAPSTTFRLRLRPMPGLNDSVLLRLFFDDKPDTHPVVTAWSETGDQRFTSPPLGAGLNLPTSEAMSIPTKGVDYIEIVVPGDGSTLLKALVTTLKTTQTSTAFDFAPAPTVNDPFGAIGPSAAAPNDTFLFGRIRATLEPGTLKLSPSVTGTETEPSAVRFDFNLESAPLLAMVTFDMLNADPAAPLEAFINNTPIGPVGYQLPDLADPAYAGLIRPLEKMRFHYSGWVRCQKIIPGSLLHAGSNALMLQLPPEAHPAAIRVIELQLKHHWPQLDYSIAPL